MNHNLIFLACALMMLNTQSYGSKSASSHKQSTFEKRNSALFLRLAVLTKLNALEIQGHKGSRAADAFKLALFTQCGDVDQYESGLDLLKESGLIEVVSCDHPFHNCLRIKPDIHKAFAPVRKKK